MWKFTKFFTLKHTVPSEMYLRLLNPNAGLLSTVYRFTINFHFTSHKLACLALGFFEHGWLHQNSEFLINCEVVMADHVKITGYWTVYQCFGDTCCVHLHGTLSL
jgi:hypothetical protein